MVSPSRPTEIDPVTRTKIDPIFQNAFSNALYVGEVALLHPSQRTSDPGGSGRIQSRKPLGEWLLTARSHIIADFKHRH